MKTKIIIFLELLRGSFWFIPALMICAAMVIAFCMVALDRQLSIDSLRFYGFMYATSPEGARAVLSAIAGSMMTVAGVIFSITIVALNLASSQFGPRLLRNFMEDQGPSLFSAPSSLLLFTVYWCFDRCVPSARIVLCRIFP